MTSRERIRTIVSGKAADRCGFWMGQPHRDTWPIYHRYFGTSSEEALRRKLGDDLRWICPQFAGSTYRHPSGLAMFGSGVKKERHGQGGPLADCREPGDIDRCGVHWPDPAHLSFDETLAQLAAAGDFYRASGFWTSFYHNIMDLFGIESYLVNMYERPELVHAVTDRVCGFYYEANELFYVRAGGQVDGFFFGNDFGTQLDLICGPAQFDEFILPWFRKFTDQAHARGYQVILHSCGAIHKVIGRLIEARVDCLHPLQALAADMDAATLARDFKGRIAFMGGIDTQELLVNGTPEAVRAEVRRVRGLLGPCLVISPSHEAILPNVPPQNVEAMAEAVRA